MGYAGEVEWMNQMEGTQRNALIGFTSERSKWASNGFTRMDANGQVKVWWQQDNFDGTYAGAIPMDDVKTRMLAWQGQACDVAVKLYVTEGDYHDQDERGYFRWVADPTSKAIVREDTGKVFQYAGAESYQIHDYIPVMEQCGQIADASNDELGIASAFLMHGGGVFVVNMELPEYITTDAGIDHRIRLMASTSMNAMFQTQWTIVDEFAVCSNSFRTNLNNAGNTFKVKHTSKSLGRLGDARSALGLVYKAAEDYTRFLDAMTQVEVSDAQFHAILDGLFAIPVPEVMGGKVKNQAAITRQENKRDTLLTMWATDPRVKPWKHTLFGAFQSYSTWNQHERPRGEALAAQIIGDIKGSTAADDDKFFAIVQGLDINLGALQAAIA